MSKAASGNPYVGPRSLRYGESIYGRDREARQLLELLIAERIVLLYSPSGAGKTSLIQAGLIPELEKEEFHVLPVIRVSRGAGGGAYSCNPYVMSALLSLEQGVPPEQAIPAEELASMQFADYLTRRESASGTDDGTFLIFDQFEEILTIDPLNREAKTDFFNQVGDALRDLKRWALFAMREDHVAALDPYVRPIPTRLKSTFRLDLLSAESARLAVQRPAKECGIEFTEDATTKLVDDLRQVSVQGPTGETVQQPGPYVEPVQLQVVCYRLWEKLDENVKAITEEQVVGTGNVDSALADYYAERVAQIAGKSGVRERVLREWFDRTLITESGIRSQVMVGSEDARELNAEAIQSLVDVHLIRGEERRGVTWLELAHDRLVKPIRADNAAWSKRNLSVLQLQAAVWNNQGRPDALCLRGQARKEAQAWADEHATELTETEREFLEVCQRIHDARKTKWARMALAVLTVVLLCFGVLTAIAVWQALIADRQRTIAEAQRKIADEQSDIATALSVAARASLLLDERLDTALLLATEAQQRSDQPDTFGTLLTAANYNPRLLSYLHWDSPVGALAFSHDGKRLATGHYNGALVLWDAKTHQPIEKFDGSDRVTKAAIRAIAFSPGPEGRSMAVSSQDGTVMLRDLQTKEWRLLPKEQRHAGDVWALAFSADSTLLASGDSQGKIVVWNLVTGVAGALRFVEREVRGMAFNPSATALVAGGRDGRISIWNRQGDAWNPQAPPTKSDPKPPAIRCLTASPDGKYLAVGRSSGAVELYNLPGSGPPMKVPESGSHDGAVTSLAFSADLKHLITTGNDGTLRLWEVPSMIEVGSHFTGHVGSVLAVAFSPDERTVASGGMDGKTVLWDSKLHVAQTVRTETFGRFSVAFSPDAAWEAYGYGPRKPAEPGGVTEPPSVTLKKRGPGDSVKELNLKLGGKSVPIVTFSGDGRCLATTTTDGPLRVFDLTKANKDGSPLRIAEIDVVRAFGDFFRNAPPKSNIAITAVGISRDAGTIAASVSADGLPAQVFAWHVATAGPLFSEPLSRPKDKKPNDDEIFAMAFSPDGRLLVTGGDAEQAVIWGVGEKGETQPINECREEHTGKIRSVAFSPDGKTFATASGDTTLILWDASGNQKGPPLTGHKAPVVTAAFSRDGKLLASGSDDHSVILWDVETGLLIGRLTGHTDTVRALAFSPDDKRLYSGSFGSTVNAGDGGIKNWELNPGKLREICGQRANRNLSRTEWKAYIRGDDYRETWPGLPVPGEEPPPK